MGQYISPARAARLRCVIDFCDVDSDKWRQYAQRQHWPLSQLYSREARALERTEKDLASRFAATVLVSEREADTFRRLVPGCADRVHVVRNGVDAAYFDSAIEDAHQSAPTPLAHAQAGGRDVVFTGAMDYWANVEGVSWFAREVWPLVRARYPDARFLVVGSRPARAVQDLVSCEGVIVTGAVPDVRPYLRRAHVAVAPLRIARGVQNKVLEAMAMRRHVVATPAAAQGIEPLPPADLHLASSALDFAASVNAVLETATPTASLANREFVLKHYDWARNLARFLELVAGESSDESAVAAA
jgi:sugar transferase (PEP-CTERM/EpsH1 system associated)